MPSEPTTAAGRFRDTPGWPQPAPGTPCAECGAALHGFPCIHHSDECSYFREGWAEARQPDAAALRTALEPIDDAIQYAIAFMNDPEGLAASREQWRDQLRTALHDLRAFAALPEPKR